MSFTTKKSLLSRVLKGDEISWNDFYETYRPLILLRGEDMGLSPTEKEDLVQIVMSEIFHKNILEVFRKKKEAELTFQYDWKKGNFRHYLKRVITNQAANIIRARHPQNLPLENAEEIPAPDDGVWEEEWRKHLYNMGLEELKRQFEPETFQIFDSYAIQGKSVETVAAFYNISPAYVYTVKSRGIKIMKQILEDLENQEGTEK